MWVRWYGGGGFTPYIYLLFNGLLGRNGRVTYLALPYFHPLSR